MADSSKPGLLDQLAGAVDELAGGVKSLAGKHDENATAIDQLVQGHDANATKIDDLGGKLAEVVQNGAQLAAEIADLRAQPWHVLSELPAMMAQVQRIVAVLATLFPNHHNELTVTPANPTEKREE